MIKGQSTDTSRQELGYAPNAALRGITQRFGGDSTPLTRSIIAASKPHRGKKHPEFANPPPAEDNDTVFSSIPINQRLDSAKRPPAEDDDSLFPEIPIDPRLLNDDAEALPVDPASLEQLHDTLCAPLQDDSR